MVNYILTLLITILGGVACHYIIKWLDGHHKGDD